MAVNKIYEGFEEAVADIFDGAAVMVGGFAGPGGTPQNLIRALRDQGAKNLILISQNAGISGVGIGFGVRPGGHYIDTAILFENKQVKRVVSAYPGSPYPSVPTAFEKEYVAGEIELELTPQGTLAERVRAGGAGIGAFYTPTGAGTLIAEGKEKKVIDGKEYILEYPLKADYALIRAYKSDKMGNLVYRGTSRNFNPLMASAAKLTIAEVDEVVETGELDPEIIVTPGIFVQRIVKIPGKGGK